MTRGRGGYRGGGNRGAQPGGAPSGQNNGQNRGRGRGGARFKNSRDAEIEMEVQAITAQLNFAHMNGPQPYRGRGRGGNYTPNRGGYYSPRGGRGSGARTPNFNDYQYTHHAKAQQARRGSGLGYQGNAGTPHSYQSYTPKGPKVTMLDLVNRPLHQPIKFVKAGTLFQDEEEIFKPTMAETEQDDAPTASQVEDMFIQNDDAPSASNKSLPQFDAFTMNDMFADSAAEEEIPTLSWGFTPEQLNGSIAPTNAVPAVVAPLTATTTTQPTAHVTRVVTESVQTQVSIISSGATGSSAASIPSSTPIPPNNGTQLDINDLFRAAAVGSGASPSVRHPAAHTMPIAPLSAHIDTAPNPEQRADEELFVIDTDGNAQQSTTMTTAEVSTSTDQLFFIDTSGGASNMDQEALHPQEESVSLDFYIDTEPSTSAPQKIRYRVTRLDAQSRALGEHTSDSSSSDEMVNDDDDGDDEVVYRPPNRNVKIQPDISFASLNISSAPLAKDGGPKALSKLTHDGHAKKLKKRAKQKRRKERQRAEVKAELAGKRDAEFYPDVTPIAGPSGSGPAPRVGDSDLEWGSDGPPQSSAPPEVPLTEAKRDTAPKNKNKGKGKAKAQSGAPRGFPASGPGALAAALFASTADDPDHGMDIDPDLELEDEQYEQMLARMLEPEASTFVTIDDVEDEARLRAEDEDMGIAERGSSGDDEDVVFEIAEAIELGMEDDLSDDDEEEDDDDLESSEEEDEEVSFSTKLGRIRAAAQAQSGSRKKSDKPSLGRDPAWDSDDDDEDDDGEDDYDALFGGSKSWNDKDEADIQDMQVRISAFSRYTFLVT
ncbi:hypothetical protein DL93DRAFT_2105774 [Clavulina sp. PMI_390]|nr:hypothetical protein DL93DRAFT_2105774 [Clavulina sp. PMI_390]